MKKLLLATAVLAAWGGLASWAHSQAAKQAKAEPKTVEGILIDMKCYSMDPANWVQDHMTPKGKMPMCATTCAKTGIPVGVLEGGKPGGKVYVLITPAMQLGDHMTKTARVTGQVALDGHGIVPDKIEVKNKDKWQEVKIATMM